MAFTTFDDYQLVHSEAAGCVCSGCCGMGAPAPVEDDLCGLDDGAPVRPVEQNAGRRSVSYDSDTGDADQGPDALMSGGAWNTTSLTFSFPNSASDYDGGNPNNEANSFQQLSALQQTAAISALSDFAAVSGLDFTQLTGSADADADLRFAMSSVPSTAWAYYPSGGDWGGDSWYNKSSFNSPDIGDYAYTTFIHEIGHAVGLKHGHETFGPGAIPSASDSMEFSVMTYRSFVGHDLDKYSYYTNRSDSYAESLMMYDIAAVQRLYGANFDYNSDDTTYSFSTSTGDLLINGVSDAASRGFGRAGNTIFRTIWDGGGTDTYDFSNYTTDIALNLAPGNHVDLDVGGNFQRADIGRFGGSTAPWSRGHVFNALEFEGDSRSLIENAVAGSGNDTLWGNAADNRLSGGAGDDRLLDSAGSDTIEGGAGADTAVFASPFSSYSFALSGNFLRVIGTAVDWVEDTVETLIFGLETTTFDAIVEGLGEPNGAPTASPDSATAVAGVPVTLDVLANDSDPEDDPLTLLALGPVSGASAAILDNRVVFTADATTSGPVVFTYTLGDGQANSATGTVTVMVSAGPQQISGTQGANGLAGGEGRDTILGLGGDDTLVGNGGDDVIEGGDGDDRASGGAGADFVTGGPGRDIVRGNEDDDLLYGESEGAETGAPDSLYGGTGRDTLDGGQSADLLYGEDGDDLIIGGQGTDTAFGGPGADTILGGSEADVLQGEGGNDSLTGGSGGDRLAGGSGADTLRGEGDSDRLDGGDGSDLLDGGAGDDILLGYGDDDTLEGGAGADTLLGEAGDDLIRGGDGPDRSFGWLGADTMEGEGGDDIFFGNDGADVISGGAGNDQVVGDGGDDTVSGDAGDDLVAGQAGADSLSGGDGDDLLDGGSEGDTLSGGDGADVLFGRIGDDLARGEAGNDTLWGGDGADTLEGGADHDRLYGETGDDVLSGGERADSLYGGRGDDTLTGGGGVDVFRFETGDDRDRVTDFELGIDLIGFSGPGSYAALSIVDDGLGNALILYGSDDWVILEGVRATSLSDDGTFFFV
ncbi:MAG: M10 family metallopeptidase [Paracoccaceae bacterium]